MEETVPVDARGPGEGIAPGPRRSPATDIGLAGLNKGPYQRPPFGRTAIRRLGKNAC